MAGYQDCFSRSLQRPRIKERTSAIPMGSRPLIGSSIEKTASCPCRADQPLQAYFNCVTVWHSPQGGKNTQVFCSGQIGIESGRFNQAGNTFLRSILFCKILCFNHISTHCETSFSWLPFYHASFALTLH